MFSSPTTGFNAQRPLPGVHHDAGLPQIPFFLLITPIMPSKRILSSAATTGSLTAAKKAFSSTQTLFHLFWGRILSKS